MRIFTRSDGLALLAVAIFAGTYPATKAAVAGGLSPVANGVLRTCIAGLCAAVVMAVMRVAPPRRDQWRATVLVGGGTLLFPCGVGWAVAVLPAGQVGVAMALLPLATVLYASVRGEPLPGWRFWLAGAVAALIVAAFAARHASISGGSGGALLQALLAVGLAMAAAAVTYVEGGRLARSRPAWQVISWGLVAWLPVTLIFAVGWCMWAALPSAGWGGRNYRRSRVASDSCMAVSSALGSVISRGSRRLPRWAPHGLGRCSISSRFWPWAIASCCCMSEAMRGISYVRSR